MRRYLAKSLTQRNLMSVNLAAYGLLPITSVITNHFTTRQSPSSKAKRKFKAEKKLKWRNLFGSTDFLTLTNAYVRCVLLSPQESVSPRVVQSISPTVPKRRLGNRIHCSSLTALTAQQPVSVTSRVTTISLSPWRQSYFTHWNKVGSNNCNEVFSAPWQEKVAYELRRMNVYSSMMNAISLCISANNGWE